MNKHFKTEVLFMNIMKLVAKVVEKSRNDITFVFRDGEDVNIKYGRKPLKSIEFDKNII